MSESEVPAQAPRSRTTRILWRVIVILIVLALLLVIGGIVFVAVGSSRAAKAIEKIRARGEPLHASEIPLPADALPPEYEVLLARIEAAVDESVELEIVGDDLEEQLIAIRAWAPAHDALPTIEAYVDCLRESAKTSDERERAQRLTWARLRDPARAHKLTECERLGVRSQQLLREPLVALASELCALPPDNGERWIRIWKASFLPKLPIRPHIWGVKSIAETAPALALDGRGEESVHRLTLALHGAQRIRGLPWVIGYLAWMLETNMAIGMFERSFALLPRTANLTAFERELTTIDPRADLERALIGERACFNEFIESFHDGVANASGENQRHEGGLIELALRLWMTHDHAFYLETMTTEIERAKLPFWEGLALRFPWEKNHELFPKWATLSSMFIPNVDATFAHVAELQARIEMAQLAILAYRDGNAAGQRAASSMIDPFDGQPLRTRIEDDGTLVMWSIGKNLVDDHAPPIEADIDMPEPLDIVWRVKPQ